MSTKGLSVKGRSAIGLPMTAEQIPTVVDAKPIGSWHDLLRIGVVWAALGMNFLLAIINANAFPVNSTVVLIVQLMVTAAAVVLILQDPPQTSPVFFIAILVVLLGYILSGLYHQKVDLRGLYDLLVIPIFILMGMTMRRFQSWMINIPVVAIVLTALVDGLLRDQFASFVNPLSYYRSTRVWVAGQDSAFTEDSGLYVGADRAGGLIFSFISDHRVGSIFLEPLSLAYFSVIATIGYAVLYERQRIKFYIGAAVCLFLSLLADTRTATFAIVVSVVIVTFVRHVHKIFVVLVPFVIVTAGGLLYMSGKGGELAFRLGLTFEGFQDSNSFAILIGDISSKQIYDSGLVALIYNVGLVAAMVQIYLISGVATFEWRKHAIVPLLAIIYVMIAAMFGGAVFSIKSAALLGTLIGASGCDRIVSTHHRVIRRRSWRGLALDNPQTITTL